MNKSVLKAILNAEYYNRFTWYSQLGFGKFIDNITFFEVYEFNFYNLALSHPY